LVRWIFSMKIHRQLRRVHCLIAKCMIREDAKYTFRLNRGS